jgi:hypothetical protein
VGNVKLLDTGSRETIRGTLNKKRLQQKTVPPSIVDCSRCTSRIPDLGPQKSLTGRCQSPSTSKLSNLISSCQSTLSFLLAQFTNRNTREKQLSPHPCIWWYCDQTKHSHGHDPSSLPQLPLVRAAAAHPLTFSPLGSLLIWASSMWGVETPRCSYAMLVNLFSSAVSPVPAAEPL